MGIVQVATVHDTFDQSGMSRLLRVMHSAIQSDLYISQASTESQVSWSPPI